MEGDGGGGGGGGGGGPGIIPSAFEHIFDAIDSAPAERSYLVRASFLEIYNEEIRDLLSKDSPSGGRLELREHHDASGGGGGSGSGSTYVRGLSAFVVKSTAEIRRLLEVCVL